MRGEHDSRQRRLRIQSGRRVRPRRALVAIGATFALLLLVTVGGTNWGRRTASEGSPVSRDSRESPKDERRQLEHAIEVDRETRGEGRADLFERLAELEHDSGDLVAAEPLYRRAVAAREREWGPDHLAVAEDCGALGGLLEDRGAYEEAETWYRRSLEIRRAHLAPTHPDLAESANDLGRLLAGRGDLHGALALYDEALRTWPASGESDACLPAWILSNRGAALLELGRSQEAGPLLREARRQLLSFLGPQHVWTQTSSERVADWLWATGRHDEAQRLRAELRRPPAP